MQTWVTIAFGLALSGCFDTVAVRRPLTAESLARVDDLTAGREGTVQLDGSTPADSVYVSDLKVGPFTTAYLRLVARAPPDDGTWSVSQWVPATVPSAALRSITVVDHARGAREGLLFGVLGGIATGALVSDAASCGHSLSDMFCPLGRLMGGIAGGVAVAGISTLVGYAIGHRTTVEFVPALPVSRESADR